jgi:hypothetical protein
MPAHIDDAPYIEQSGLLGQLSARFDGATDPPCVRWVCPVCHGAEQVDEVELIDVVKRAATPESRPLDLICRCGYAHGDHQGCGYGAMVEIPASALG